MLKLVPWGKGSFKRDETPVAIISLSNAEQRRAALIQRGFSPELVNGFWPACDMRGLADTRLQKYSQYHDMNMLYDRSPISAELGCLFSHSDIIRWLSVQDTISQVVIFEDDVVPQYSNHIKELATLASSLLRFSKIGEAFICHLGASPNVLKYSFSKKLSNSNYKSESFELSLFSDNNAKLWLAHAYIISKEAAKRYVELCKLKGFLADDWRFIIDNTQSKMLILDPALYFQDADMKSMIDPTNKRQIIEADDFTKNKESYLFKSYFSCIFLKLADFLKNRSKRIVVLLSKIFSTKVLF